MGVRAWTIGPPNSGLPVVRKGLNRVRLRGWHRIVVGLAAVLIVWQFLNPIEFCAFPRGRLPVERCIAGSRSVDVPATMLHALAIAVAAAALLVIIPARKRESDAQKTHTS